MILKMPNRRTDCILALFWHTKIKIKHMTLRACPKGLSKVSDKSYKLLMVKSEFESSLVLKPTIK